MTPIEKAIYGEEPKDEQPSSKPTQAPAAPAAPVKFIAEHTVQAGETLSGLAQKYYGSAAQEKWMAIYEANKAVIGSNPGMVKTGLVLKIPELPK